MLRGAGGGDSMEGIPVLLNTVGFRAVALRTESKKSDGMPAFVVGAGAGSNAVAGLAGVAA
jgi:hypothetical protein